MLRRIRELMNTPFARPPERRSIWGRYAPELSAAGVYIVLMYAGVVRGAIAGVGHARWQPAWWEPFADGAIMAYALMAVILTWVPLGLVATTWPGEHRRGTLEALVLTPGDKAKVARGRYWLLVGPWVRFWAWMLPLYVLMGLSGFARGAADNIGDTIAHVLFASASKPVFVMAGIEQFGHHEVGWSWLGLLLATLRMFKDGVGLLLVTALGYYLSAHRMRSGGAALTACVVAPLLLGTVFSLPEYALFIDRTFFSEPGGSWLYALMAIGALALELWVIGRALRFVARNFDAWALGEKAGR